MHPLAPPLPSRHHAPTALQLGPPNMLACRPQALEHLGRGLADLVGHFFAPSLRRPKCTKEQVSQQAHVSRIKGDEGELDALATYLEAVQVFLRQHIHMPCLR